MKLSPPSVPVFLLSLLLALAAVAGSVMALPFVSAYAPWLAIVAYLLLSLAVLLRRL